ncbi:hypothetical protein WJX81_000958 [Elliptochloris bilobata]|uniref:RING-type domain-containing protein n=1 Tax=Elliptochloris bilobata TaxID=381761 RepID=A0AAW1SKL7_9CHLO
MSQGPSTRPAPKPGRGGGTRRRSAQIASPASNRGTAGGPQQQPAGDARASLEIVDLTGGSLEDEVVVTHASSGRKRARLMPLPFSAPQLPPPEAKAGAKCAICLEPMSQMACGPCGHVFCDSCLRASVKVNKRCPTCRKGLQLRQIHRIYLSLD